MAGREQKYGFQTKQQSYLKTPLWAPLSPGSAGTTGHANLLLYKHFRTVTTVPHRSGSQAGVG